MPAFSPATKCKVAANVLIFANADAASGVRNILKSKADGLEVGPILMGLGNKAHIVTPSITARGLLNMAAIAEPLSLTMDSALCMATV